MTMKGFTAVLALVFGFCAIAALPAHAGTVNVTYNYVYFGYVGKHQRQPRMLGSYGGFTLIATQPGGQQSTGNTFQPGQVPMTEMVGNTTYYFAFVTITGGSTTANGPTTGVTSTNSNQPPSVVVQNSPIVVLAVYVPHGGVGQPGSPSGATIDSFDETTGSLFNDTFVKVAPDQNGAETTQGNVYGYVDTTNTAETITTLSPTQPTGVDFSRWLNLYGSPGINGPALSAAKGANSISLAFYDAPPTVIIQKSQCQQELDSLNQVTKDRGPLLTVTMYNGIKAFLAKCVLQHQLTQTEVTQAENAYQAMLNSLHNPPPPPPHL